MSSQKNSVAIYRAQLDEDRILWSEALSTLPVDRVDVYFTPEYLLPFESIGRGEATCFVFTQGLATFIYPFIKQNCLLHLFNL